MSFYMGHKRCFPRKLVCEHIMSDVRDMAASESVRLVFMLVPTKVQVYGRLVSDRSNQSFKDRLARQLVYENNFSQAFAVLARRLNLDYIDLLPVFRELAPSCLLYSPFDTHWNINGRRVAADLVADWITARNGQANAEKFDPSRFRREICAPNVLTGSALPVESMYEIAGMTSDGWFTPESKLIVKVPLVAKQLTLTLEVPGWMPFNLPVHLQAIRNGKMEHIFQFASPGVHKIVLPLDKAGTIAFNIDNWFVPAQLGINSGDERPLAYRLKATKESTASPCSDKSTRCSGVSN